MRFSKSKRAFNRNDSIARSLWVGKRKKIFGKSGVYVDCARVKLSYNQPTRPSPVIARRRLASDSYALDRNFRRVMGYLNFG